MISDYSEISADELANQLAVFRLENKQLLFSNIYSFDVFEINVLFKRLNESLVFLIKNELFDFYKVYFLTANLDSLKTLLSCVTNKNCILEFITKDAINVELLYMFEQTGFSQYATLKKMSLLAVNEIVLNAEAIEIANSIYADAIHEILVNKFDKYVDRIPSKRILDKAIQDELILVALNNGMVSGFLWFDLKKVVSEIRYLYVCPEFRGKGVSSALMNEYQKKVLTIKKKQLWVLSENNVALNLYHKFGYEFENLSDIILVRRTTK